jgi:hypothetical protein
MHLVLFSLLVCCACVLVSAGETDKCVNGVCLAFKDYGLPAKKTFSSSTDGKESKELSLVSAGMRRKNLVVFEVDVYTVGVYVSKTKDDELKKTAKGKDLASEFEKSDGTTNVAINLSFVRDVETAKVVDAIVEAMSDTGDEFIKALKQFSDILVAAIGSEGMKKNGVLSLVFHSQNSLSVSLNDNFAGMVSNNDIRLKLLDIYLGEKAVAPEVVKIAKARY